MERRFAFGAEEREAFRMFMRMQKNFSGCRVLSYCVMSNHFHILLEVPAMPEDGISDGELLKRLSAINSEAFVATVAKELGDARAEEDDARVAEIRARGYRNFANFQAIAYWIAGGLVIPVPANTTH